MRYVEEEVEAAAVGKGSVAVGEVADSVEADLVVLSTAGGRVERAGGWAGGWVGGHARRRGVVALLHCCLTAAAARGRVHPCRRCCKSCSAGAVLRTQNSPCVAAAAVHEKHVDANLLAEFVGCPIMMLP